MKVRGPTHAAEEGTPDGERSLGRPGVQGVPADTGVWDVPAKNWEKPLGLRSSRRCSRDICSGALLWNSALERATLDPADGIDRTFVTRQGILPFRMPFPRDELRRHERTRPERRALVAPGSSTVKHNSYRRWKGPSRYPGKTGFGRFHRRLHSRPPRWNSRFSRPECVPSVQDAVQ